MLNWLVLHFTQGLGYFLAKHTGDRHCIKTYFTARQSLHQSSSSVYLLMRVATGAKSVAEQLGVSCILFSISCICCHWICCCIAFLSHFAHFFLDFLPAGSLLFSLVPVVHGLVSCCFPFLWHVCNSLYAHSAAFLVTVYIT